MHDGVVNHYFWGLPDPGRSGALRRSEPLLPSSYGVSVISHDVLSLRAWTQVVVHDGVVNHYCWGLGGPESSGA